MVTKNWFEVDRKGLKQLQDGKSKTFIVRELLQNAFDEEITTCKLYLTYNGYNNTTIIVEDDSPIGFRDLTDSFTLFKDTYKRDDVKKRGRFNLGEKQVFAMCETAEIITTVGNVIFDEEGRKSGRRKREKGSIITINLKLTEDEVMECFEYAQNVIFPKGVEFTIYLSRDKGQNFETRTPEFVPAFRTFEATLRTEVNFDGIYRQTSRKTNIDVRKANGKKFLYEMGLPVCEIECDYSIDVQQKVPLSADRDSVVPSFLRDLYAEVLNNVYDEINEDTASNVWVREATTSDRITKDAFQTVLTERYGDKVVVANPSDPNANDEAISRGYKVIYGSEMGADEWKNVKNLISMPSSTAMFGKSLVGYSTVHPSTMQKKVGDWCKKFYKDYFNTDLYVQFISAPPASTMADFGDDTIRFNIPKISFKWTENNLVSQRMLDLIIHEFGHKRGNHTEHSYHEALTGMGAWLTYKALHNPKYFDL